VFFIKSKFTKLKAKNLDTSPPPTLKEGTIYIDDQDLCYSIIEVDNKAPYIKPPLKKNGEKG
jgi:hypothetical protein